MNFMSSFNFNTSRSIRFGAGRFEELGEMVKGEIGTRVVLVTDPGMMATGIAERAAQILKSNQVEVTLFKDVEADPSEAVVMSGCAATIACGAQGVIGLGGGSSMDVAKLVALLAPGNQGLSDAYGIGKAKGPRLPLILIPTTSGTGSEVTPISIVTTGTHEKMGVVSQILLPDIALLDPELTLGLPPHVTAATGIDAMVHAIEAYTSINANNNPLSRNLAKQALQLMGPTLEKVVHDGADMDARSDMQIGSMMAGQAFANSPVAAVHALAYPIGGRFHVPHGLSNALVLPHVLRFNCEVAYEPYSELAPHVFPKLADLKNPTERAEAFVLDMASLSKRCGLPQSLREVDIPRESLPKLADDAMKQTRLLVNNPRQLSKADVLQIYEAAW